MVQLCLKQVKILQCKLPESFLNMCMVLGTLQCEFDWAITRFHLEVPLNRVTSPSSNAVFCAEVWPSSGHKLSGKRSYPPSPFQTCYISCEEKHKEYSYPLSLSPLLFSGCLRIRVVHRTWQNSFTASHYLQSVIRTGSRYAKLGHTKLWCTGKWVMLIGFDTCIDRHIWKSRIEILSLEGNRTNCTSKMDPSSKK